MAIGPSPIGGSDVSALVNQDQTRNQILTSILAAINAAAKIDMTGLANLVTAVNALTTVTSPVSLTGSGPQRTQQITGNGQAIAVGSNGSTVLTTTTGGAMTGMILGTGSMAGQRFTIINTTAFSITFAASGTSNVFGTPTQAANVGQTYIWDGTNLLWRQVA